MTEQQKSQAYGVLLNRHRQLHNQINEIKGQSIDLDKKQLDEIKRMEREQTDIMFKIKNLLSK